jgi:hypothetical protein
MNRISNLDKVLNHIYSFSNNLSSISDFDMSLSIGIEIDELSEYLEELDKRGLINIYDNGSYITLRGRLAIENSKNKQPFKDELNNKRLNKYWTITKIAAGTLNAIIIIGIAIWAQKNSNEKTRLENEISQIIELSKNENNSQNQINDSLKSIISVLSKEREKFLRSNEIPQGSFIYELYFAEFGGRMENTECNVIIKGNEITIEQTAKTNLTGDKEIFKGLVLKHKSGKWILADDAKDVSAEEIGGCTDIPIITFDKKLIEWC